MFKVSSQQVKIAAGGSSSRTGTVQFDSFGTKGFEQKDLIKQNISMQLKVMYYTANVDLTSTFGDVKTLTGTISTVDVDVSIIVLLLDGTDANVIR